MNTTGLNTLKIFWPGEICTGYENYLYNVKVRLGWSNCETTIMKSYIFDTDRIFFYEKENRLHLTYVLLHANINTERP